MRRARGPARGCVAGYPFSAAERCAIDLENAIRVIPALKI